MVQTKELQRTKKKHITYISRNRRLLQKTFLLRYRSFYFSGKFAIFSESSLISDCKEIVQPRELQKTKKKETYLISPTSREREDFQRRLFFY